MFYTYYLWSIIVGRGHRQHGRQNILLLLWISRFCVRTYCDDNVCRQPRTRETIVIIIKTHTWKEPPTLEPSKTVPNANLFLAVFISFLFVFLFFFRPSSGSHSGACTIFIIIIYYCCSADVRIDSPTSAVHFFCSHFHLNWFDCCAL